MRSLEPKRSTPASRRTKRSVKKGFFAGLAGLLAASCQPVNHFILHPQQLPTGINAWTEEVRRGDLVLRLEWAKPDGAGPFPAVLVHPEAGKTAADMRGVVFDLARSGYLAAAADYRRIIQGKLQTTMFPWREDAEAVIAYETLRGRPETERGRIGLLGFSQGGVYSLLMAAQVGEGVKAVVAYYPITDFSDWLDENRAGSFWERAVRGQIRSYFRTQSGAATDEEFAAVLRRASVMAQAEAITAPVLLIHGAKDATAPVEQSKKLYERLKELERKVELLVIPGAVHVFNFRNREQAATAWEATLRWLDRNLGSKH
jgi:dienelactone hydrolase